MLSKEVSISLRRGAFLEIAILFKESMRLRSNSLAEPSN